MGYAFSTWVPFSSPPHSVLSTLPPLTLSHPLSTQEYAEQLVAFGLVGEAMGLYERLELWDSLIACMQVRRARVCVNVRILSSCACRWSREEGLGA